jgi:UDP-glucose:(heptosyl)LPS alpha-1,3-glucosyltransferase
LGLPVTGHCILFVGNDYRKKGLPTLLQALKQLPADSFLVVVGNAAQIAEFRPQVHALGLQDRVFFLGALSNINSAYRAADCLAHPTLEDTFGMVVLEAMAHGLPVVVSGAAFCGIADFLTHAVNAYVLKAPSDVQQVVQGLLAVLPPSDGAAKLALSGQVFARDHLWSAQARHQEAIYQRVAAESAYG